MLRHFQNLSHEGPRYNIENTVTQMPALNFDLVGLGKNMGNLILAINNVFSLNKKFHSGLFFQCNTVAQ